MLETKKCPFCAENILLEAKKCKHCGEFLEKIEINNTNSEKIELTFRKKLILIISAIIIIISIFVLAHMIVLNIKHNNAAWESIGRTRDNY